MAKKRRPLTNRQKAKIANRILAKSGYFKHKVRDAQVLPEAEMLGVHGLKPIWHGRAS